VNAVVAFLLIIAAIVLAFEAVAWLIVFGARVVSGAASAATTSQKVEDARIALFWFAIYLVALVVILITKAGLGI
jgi:hypothetical protein